MLYWPPVKNCTENPWGVKDYVLCTTVCGFTQSVCQTGATLIFLWGLGSNFRVDSLLFYCESDIQAHHSTK